MHPREVVVSPGRFCIQVLAVAYVSVHFAFERLMTWVLVAGGACDRAFGLNGILSRHALAWLTGAVIVTAALGAGVLDIPLRTPYLRWPAYAVTWIALMYVLTIAHFHVSALPDPEAIPDSIARHPWESRLSRCLRQPLNAIFLRTVLANSVLIVPLAAAVILPGHVSWFAGLSYVTMFAVGSLAHETLDHTDIHNHLFRPGENASGWSSLVPRAIHRYLRAILNPLFCRMPSYYRVQHIYIHHVENNGPDDVQSTVRHDRTSFFDFCVFALKCGASFTFAHDVIAYLWRKRKKRPLRRLLAGAAYWLSILVVIALHNPAAALLLFGVRFFFGTAIALNVYVWHGLADPADPGNVLRNSINVRIGANGSPSALHMRHHQRMGEHWSRQCAVSAEEIDAHATQGALTLDVMSPNLFVKALWARRFDLIAQRVVTPGRTEAAEAQEHTQALCTLIGERTGPVTPRYRSATWRRMDSLCARMFTHYVVAGGRLPPAT